MLHRNRHDVLNLLLSDRKNMLQDIASRVAEPLKKAIVAEMTQHCAAPVLALLKINEPELQNPGESVDARRPRTLNSLS